MNRYLEPILSQTLEAVLAHLPHGRPNAASLARARIVSHRGERNGSRVRENTFAAFDPAVAAGVAGVEFDIRYTRDDEPVVIHDPNLRRVFGLDRAIAYTPWRTLRRCVPEVPHLDALIQRYAPRAHLMMELKTRGSERAERRLTDLLAELNPGRDFHVLSLDPRLFAGAARLPAACRLPVAKLNLYSLYDWALAHDCAGLAGPMALMHSRRLKRLQRARPIVASGFINSPTMCLREIARGADWIFSNQAVRLQRALDAARRHPAPS